MTFSRPSRKQWWPCKQSAFCGAWQGERGIGCNVKWHCSVAEIPGAHSNAALQGDLWTAETEEVDDKGVDEWDMQQGN